MVRAPCCEKMGLKRGPWTAGEDMTLVAHIEQHGHSNWRALPKQAGLLRCGKSCRLRWINYLRPDLKRGAFSPQEEDLIVNLHAILGNRYVRPYSVPAHHAGVRHENYCICLCVVRYGNAHVLCFFAGMRNVLYLTN